MSFVLGGLVGWMQRSSGPRLHLLRQDETFVRWPSYEHLLRRVWRLEADADLRPMRTVIRSLRRKLGDDFKDPTYIFTQLRVGYRMPKGGV